MSTLSIIRLWHIEPDDAVLQKEIASRIINHHNASDTASAMVDADTATDPKQSEVNYVQIESALGEVLIAAERIFDDFDAWNVELFGNGRDPEKPGLLIQVLAYDIKSLATILAAMLVIEYE